MKTKLKIGAKVTPRPEYKQELSDTGEVLKQGEIYEVKKWYNFYGSIKLILTNNVHCYLFSVKIL